MFHMNFNIICNHDETSARAVVLLLGPFGIKVTDLRESDILDSEDSKAGEVYVLCCRGTKKSYEAFKKTHDWSEIVYEGVKTLI